MQRVGLGLGLGLPGPQFPANPWAEPPPLPEGFAFLVDPEDNFIISPDGDFWITENE